MLRGLVLSLAALPLAACSLPPGRGGETRQPPVREGPPAIATSQSGQCFARLGAAGVNFSPLPDRYLAQGCTNLGTVQLRDLPSDASRLAIVNVGPVTCEVSQAFAAWARFGADRAARQILGSPLRAVETFGSYSCRDVAGSGRRSAHATAAAIDISGFVLADGRRITIAGGWDGRSEAERRFLRIVHHSACRRFATVLGPDYNSAHRDHLHFEGVAQARAYCR